MHHATREMGSWLQSLHLHQRSSLQRIDRMRYSSVHFKKYIYIYWAAVLNVALTHQVAAGKKVVNPRYFCLHDEYLEEMISYVVLMSVF